MLQLNRTDLGCFGVWGETAGYRDALASKEVFDLTQSKIKLFNIWDKQTNNLLSYATKIYRMLNKNCVFS